MEPLMVSLPFDKHVLSEAEGLRASGFIFFRSW
jgi:hypothetical protein